MPFIKAYRWIVPALLFTAVLLVLRLFMTGTVTFFFLSWNIFLAVLPLYFSHKLEGVSMGAFRAAVLLALWLIFFPNAMYIVTDLFHLRKHTGIPLWYDLLLLMSAALTGIVMGFVSLHNVERWLMQWLQPRYTHLIVFVLFLLCGYGIYMGRYLRWNSWDVVVQPYALLADVRTHVVHPFRNIDCWLVTILFGMWLHILYYYFRRAGKIMEGEIK